MTQVRCTEIADGVHQFTTHLAEIDFGLNQYLVDGDELVGFEVAEGGSLSRRFHVGCRVCSWLRRSWGWRRGFLGWIGWVLEAERWLPVEAMPAPTSA